MARLVVGTSRPVRDPAHLFRLLALELDGVDIGFGVEFMLLEALETATLAAAQADLAADTDAAELDRLVDQLAQRLRTSRIVRLQPVDSHIPERAQELVPAGKSSARALARPSPRPLRLLPRPRAGRGHGQRARRPALAGAPPSTGASSPPSAPERILPEWWRHEAEAARLRDFYRVSSPRTAGASGVSREGMYGEAKPPEWRVQEDSAILQNAGMPCQHHGVAGEQRSSDERRQRHQSERPEILVERHGGRELQPPHQAKLVQSVKLRRWSGRSHRTRNPT